MERNFRFFNVKDKTIHMFYHKNLIKIKISLNGNPVTTYRMWGFWFLYWYKNILKELKNELEILKKEGLYLPEEELEGIKEFLKDLKKLADEAKIKYEQKGKIFDAAIEAVSKYLEEAE